VPSFGETGGKNEDSRAQKHHLKKKKMKKSADDDEQNGSQSTQVECDGLQQLDGA
jgi:hypothetical protein